MKKLPRKSSRSQTTQVLMKKKPAPDSQFSEIQVVLGEYCKDLDDSDDLKINPLPTPVYTHLEACNIETPRLNYCPSLASSIYQRASELKWRFSRN